MKKPAGITLGAVLLLCFFTFASAGAESSIWKLESEESDFYIAGSLHLLKKSDYPLPKEFEAAYQAAEQIIFETSLKEFTKPETQRMLLMKGMYTDGKTIQDHVTQETYERLEKYLRGNRLPVESFKVFRPWMLIMNFTALELRKNGINPQDGIDQFFYRRSKQDQKLTGGLVPAREHVEVISSSGDELNDDPIDNFFEEFREIIPVINELRSAWRGGNEEKIDEYITGRMRKEYPAIYKIMIADRNRRWVPAIEKLIRSGDDTMVIVGVGHIAGEDSVIKLLAASGYRFRKFSP